MSQNLTVPLAPPPPPWLAEPPPQAARSGAEAAAAAKPRNPLREKADDAMEDLADTVFPFRPGLVSARALLDGEWIAKV
jgi:hypothetical protein